MTRTPEQCPFRGPVGLVGGEEAADCRLVGQITGLDGDAPYRVRRETCDACCRSAPPGAATMNPVVASLVFDATAQILERGGVPGCDVARAERVRHEAVLSLDLVLPELFAPRGERDVAASARPPLAARRKSSLTWSVGVITVPRAEPTLGRTLRSLERAGFDDVHVIAQAGAPAAEAPPGVPVTILGSRLGGLAHLYASLTVLYLTHPGADCYALFQDGVEVAAGLREWCDRQFWPEHAGLVSLVTPRAEREDAPGWRTTHLGHYRTFGAPALVLRRDVLFRFLGDLQSLRLGEDDRRPAGAVVGTWAARAGVGVAYHTPPLAWDVSDEMPSLGAAAGTEGPDGAGTSVSLLSSWRPRPRAAAKVGLIGWNTATGLGSINRDLAVHGVADRWLALEHPQFATLPDPDGPCRIDYPSGRRHGVDPRRWLNGLDWVVCVEHPYIESLIREAHESGHRVAWVPMWELAHPQVEWLKYVDLVLCPHAWAYDLFASWKERYGAAWDVVHVPWPVDTRHFAFRQRTTCRRFVFVNGTGGCRARRLRDGRETPRRKGLDLVLDAALLVPAIPILTYTQMPPTRPLPANVELTAERRTRAELYQDGDVCVQPSHWEGLGLSLLECQAAGMPLVTTDAPPMNEFRPLRVIPVDHTEPVAIADFHPFTAHFMSAQRLAAVLSELHGSDVVEASRTSRAFVEREHSWDRAGRRLRELLTR
jgi:glycosyltransferase involved in cell wall biosynthesis